MKLLASLCAFLLSELCLAESDHAAFFEKLLDNKQRGLSSHAQTADNARLLMTYKGKGMGMMMMMGKGSDSSSKGKGKGSDSSSMSYKGKGKGSDSSSMSYKGKGYDYKGKGSSMSYKGKGYDSKGKGYDSKGKGKGAPPLPTLFDIIVDTKDLSTLELAIDTIDALDVFKMVPLGWTALAPANMAFSDLQKFDPEFFEALLTDPWVLHLDYLLSTHIIESEVKSTDLSDGLEVATLSGDKLTVSITDGGVCFKPSFANEGGCVIIADVMAKNGIAHVIDAVLFPYYYEFGIASLAVELQNDAGLTSLVALITCAGLGKLVDETFGITVFAPTDDAFKGFDAEYLCSDKGLPELTEILSYHVVPAVIPSVLIPSGKTSVDTLLGKPVLVEKYYDDTIKVNGANVVVADVLAYNGIVHVIDEVLLPPSPPPAKGKGKGKGKGAPAKGKGKGKGYSYKGKGSSMSYKGKGSDSSSMSYKGKGMSSMSYKGKGMSSMSSMSKGMSSMSSMSKGMSSMSYKGKGYY